MKHFKISLLVLILVLALMFGIATAESVGDVRSDDILFLISDDQKDTVLSTPEKHSALADAIGIITGMQAGSGAQIRIGSVGDVAKSGLNGCSTFPANDAGAITSVMKAAEAMKTGENKGKLDSGLCDALAQLSGYTGDVYLITDGEYAPGYKWYKNIQNSVSGFNSFAVITLSSANPDAIKEVTGKANGAYIDLSSDYMQGIVSTVMGAMPNAYTGIDAQTEQLLDVWGYLAEDGSFRVTRPEQEICDVFGTAKDVSVEAQLLKDTILPGDAITITVHTPEEASGEDAMVSVTADSALRLTYWLDGAQVDAVNGKIASDALVEGPHTLCVKGECDVPGMEIADSSPLSFTVMPLPRYAGADTYTASSTPEAPKTFVTELSKTSAFENDADDVSVKSETDGVSAGFTNDGYLYVEVSEDASVPASAQVTLQSDGIEGTAVVTLNYFPDCFQKLKLTDAGTKKDYYIEDDPAKLDLSLDEASKAIIAGHEEWLNLVEVAYTDANGNRAVLPYANGTWSYREAVKKDRTVDFTINGCTDACYTFEPQVYAQDELTAGILKNASVNFSGADTAVKLGDSFPQITVYFDESVVENLEGAPDINDKKACITAAYCLGEPANDDAWTDLGACGDTYTWTIPALGGILNDVNLTVQVSLDEAQIEGCKGLKTLNVDKSFLPWLRYNALMIFERIKAADIKTKCIYAGCALAALILLILLIKLISRPRFHGVITMNLKLDGSEYDGTPIDLEPWGKQTVTLGSLISSSGLPPATILMDNSIMDKINVKPLSKRRIRITNRSRDLSSDGKKVTLYGGDSMSLRDTSNCKLTIDYKAR